MSDAIHSAAKTVVILGMHRSGTSFVTRALNRCGLHLGNDLLTAPSLSNAEGKWEARKVVEINDRLLADSGGAWDKVPDRLAPHDDLLARMRSFLAELRSSPVAGWKDPRTVLTYPLWKPLLDNHRIVACWRHPASVAESLALREGWSVEKSLNLWCCYNERLLDDVEHESDVIWFDFEMPAELFAAWLQEACRRLGLEFDPDAARSFNAFHQHHRHTQPPDDPRLRSVYDRLRYKTRDFLATLKAASPPAAPASPLTAPSGELSPVWALLSEQVRDLAKVHRQQNALVQRLERHVHKTSRQVRQLQECTDGKASAEACATVEERLRELDEWKERNYAESAAGFQERLEMAAHLQRQLSAQENAIAGFARLADRLERRIREQEQVVQGFLARWTRYQEEWLAYEQRLENCLVDLENEATIDQARLSEFNARLARLETWEQRLRYSTGYGIAQRIERFLNWWRARIRRLRPGVPAPHIGRSAKTIASPPANA